MPAAKPLPRGLLIVGVVVPVLSLIAVLASRAVGDDSPDDTGRYSRAIEEAFADVNPELLSMVETSGRWLTGEAEDDELAGALRVAASAIPAAREVVADLDEPDSASPARSLYVATLDLYAVVVDATRSALAAAGEERTERDLLARRVRALADRLYDRARAIVSPTDHVGDDDGVTVVRSAPVPDWEEEGLAADVDAGAELDERAAAQPDDEPGRRRGLRLLVLAEAERAAALGLIEVADALADVAASLPD